MRKDLEQRPKMFRIVGIVLILIVTFIGGYVSHDTITFYIQQRQMGFSETINFLRQHYPEYDCTDWDTWEELEEHIMTYEPEGEEMIKIIPVKWVEFRKILENDYYEYAIVYFDRSARVIWYIAAYGNDGRIILPTEQRPTEPVIIKVYALKVKKW